MTEEEAEYEDEKKVLYFSGDPVVIIIVDADICG